MKSEGSESMIKIMMRAIKRMEDKLIELMGEEAYTEFATKIATEAFREEVEGMEDDEFRELTLANFDDITAEPDKPFVALTDVLYVARESEK